MLPARPSRFVAFDDSARALGRAPRGRGGAPSAGARIGGSARLVRAARGLSGDIKLSPLSPRGPSRSGTSRRSSAAARTRRPAARVRVVDDWAHPTLLCDRIGESAPASRPLYFPLPPISRARARGRVAPPRARLSSALGPAPPRASPPPFFPRQRSARRSVGSPAPRRAPCGARARCAAWPACGTTRPVADWCTVTAVGGALRATLDAPRRGRRGPDPPLSAPGLPGGATPTARTSLWSRL